MTDAEKAFMVMCRMADLEVLAEAQQTANGIIPPNLFRRFWSSPDRTVSVTARYAGSQPAIFPIVASTFEALTIERPELREHYERAREAWEASQ